MSFVFGDSVSSSYLWRATTMGIQNTAIHYYSGCFNTVKSILAWKNSIESLMNKYLKLQNPNLSSYKSRIPLD